jgi:hypothetical protein
MSRKKKHQRGYSSDRYRKLLLEAKWRIPSYEVGAYFERMMKLYAHTRPDHNGRVSGEAAIAQDHVDRLLKNDPLPLYSPRQIAKHPWLADYARYHARQRHKAKIIVNGSSGRLIVRVIDYLARAGALGVRLSIADLLVLIRSRGVTPTVRQVLWVLSYLRARRYLLVRRRYPRGDRYHLAALPPTRQLTDANPKPRGSGNDFNDDIPF